MKEKFKIQSLRPETSASSVESLRPKVSKFKILVFILLLFTIHCSLSTVVEAKVYIDINAPYLRKLPVAVVNLMSLSPSGEEKDMGRNVAGVISNDLDFSGFFRILDQASFIEPPQKMAFTEDRIDFKDWSVIGAEVLVKGTIKIEGGRLNIELKLFDVFQGRLLIGKKYTGVKNDVRKIAHRFSNEIVKALTGEEGVFDTKIAYVAKVRDGKEVYIMDFDGYAPQRITKIGGFNLSPSWSPDGREILFASERRRNWDLYVFDRRQLKEDIISYQVGLNFAASFSPDGKKIALTMSRDGNPEIYTINREGKDLRRLTNNFAIDVSPRWSLDGKQIVFVSNRGGSPQIYIMDSDGNNVRRLTFEGSYNTSPAWSPRGDKIAFTSRINGKFQISIINPDGSGLQQLTFNTGNNEDPSWSSDGRYIAFSSTREGKYAIFVMLANGEGQRRISPGGIEAFSPSWSPRLTE
ncbi:MAG: Tol-Pal system beta propeller repeat protein TolB [Nitrospirota bacterium]